MGNVNIANSNGAGKGNFVVQSMAVDIDRDLSISDQLLLGLRVFYNFDGDINDSSGNGFHLTPANSSSFKYIDGINGRGVSFNSKGTCGRSPGLYNVNNLWDSTTATAASNYSISFWLKLGENVTTNTNNANIGRCSSMILGQAFGKMGLAVHFAANKTNVLAFSVVAVGGTIEDSQPMLLNTWYNFTCTHDAVKKIIKLYKNGNLIASTRYSGSVARQNTWEKNDWRGFAINGSGSTGSSYKPPIEYGQIVSFDNVGFWNRELTILEISALHNTGNGIKLKGGIFISDSFGGKVSIK